jgi:LysM repeat protein
MYEFYIDDLRLPVAPEKLTTKVKGQNKTVSLLNEGEINTLKLPGLTEFDFEVLLPNVEYPFAYYQNGFKTADYYLEKFESLIAGKKSFVFKIVRIDERNKLYDTNMSVSLEDYTIDENANEGSDITVKISLKQYKEYGLKKLDIPVSTVDPEPIYLSINSQKRSEPDTPTDYTVVSGDTLWKICKRALGDGGKYPEIAKLNDISNPNLIYPGQVIKFG